MVNSTVFRAILAMDSYNRGYNPKITEGLGGENSQIGNVIITDESNTDESSQEFQANFYAVAYRDNSTGEKIISYRGTDNILDDMITGWTTGLGAYNYLGPQARFAAQFYDAVIGEANTSPYSANVSFTGHSLGGGLAGLMASLYGKEAIIFNNMPFELAAANDNFVEYDLSSEYLYVGRI